MSPYQNCKSCSKLLFALCVLYYSQLTVYYTLVVVESVLAPCFKNISPYNSLNNNCCIVESLRLTHFLFQSLCDHKCSTLGALPTEAFSRSKYQHVTSDHRKDSMIAEEIKKYLKALSVWVTLEEKVG